MASKKVLVLGSKGMLGQELVRVYSEDAECEVSGWDREDIDIADFPAAEKKIREYAPNIILNAVAYNAVDKCEESDEEYAKALLLNATVPEFLARLAKDMDVTLAHYSTDYVFDGMLEENKKETGCCGGGCCGAQAMTVGYDETSVPNPLSRYGETKLLGEKSVRTIGGKFYVIRLSKLFGKPALSAAGKRSFFEIMLEKSKENGAVSVVDDEMSCFTYAPDLAQATKALTDDQALYGTYHLVNETPVTWYIAAKELFNIAKLDVVVRPVSADTFPRPAKRPKCSVLLNTKRPKLRPYPEALEEYIMKFV